MLRRAQENDRSIGLQAKVDERAYPAAIARVDIGEMQDERCAPLAART